MNGKTIGIHSIVNYQNNGESIAFSETFVSFERSALKTCWFEIIPVSGASTEIEVAELLGN